MGLMGRALRDRWHIVAAILMRKMDAQSVKISLADVVALDQSGKAIVADGLGRGVIKLSLVDRAEAEAVASELVIERILAEFYDATGVIDNGKCAVCRIGYRLWKLPQCQAPAGPCSNEECLTRQADELLEEYRRRHGWSVGR